MSYADKEVVQRIPIEVQRKRFEVMQQIYHEHLLRLLHHNMIDRDEMLQSERESDFIGRSLDWLETNRDAVLETRKALANRAE